MRLAGGLFVLAAASASAQPDELRPVRYPTLPTFVRQPAELAPQGWKAVATKAGDLNSDNRPDVAVLLRMTDPANVKPVESNPYYKQDDTNPYLLAIGFARSNGYVLAASHHSLFPREVAPMHGDDPPGADTVKIERNILTIYLGHLRGHTQLRFRWDGRVFGLIGVDCRKVAGGQIRTLSANYLTHRARLTSEEIGSEKVHETLVRIRPGKRPTLDRIDWDFDAGTDVDGNGLGC